MNPKIADDPNLQANHIVLLRNDTTLQRCNVTLQRNNTSLQRNHIEMPPAGRVQRTAPARPGEARSDSVG